MKKVCIWTGTDALTLVKYPPGNHIWWVKLFLYRIKWLFLKRLFDEHWIRSERLSEYLSKFGIKRDKVYQSEIKVIDLVKIPHEGVNVLYYLPDPANLGGVKHRNWARGYDIFNRLYIAFPMFNFIIVKGRDDMNKIYQVIDCYIRPNRIDGMPRMIMECEAYGIPYCWSVDGKPNFDVFYEFLNKFKHE